MTPLKLCNVKSHHAAGNILHRQEAIDQDCTEALLVKDGFVTEGAASNVFAVIGWRFMHTAQRH